ncbi:MAG: hypothetical protein AAF914_08155 [Pseudomonadota bacterium]
MRRESDFDDAGIIVIVLALFLFMAAMISMAVDRPSDRREANSFGPSSSLLGREPEIRVNELPQIR